MALTPWNRQEEWYQQMINASTGNYLPSISAQDAGKVMTVESDGSWGVENVPTELPAVETTDKDKYLHTNASTGAVEWSAVEDELPAVTSSDKDKYLHTNDSTGAVEWADAPDALPAVTDVDEGKVLTVNNSGVWVAANPSSGGGALVVTDTDGTLDKTWQEIHDAMLNGIVMVNVVSADGNEETLKTYIFSSTGIGEDKGGNPFYDASSIGFAGTNAVQRYYSTNSASGYPVLDPFA